MNVAYNMDCMEAMRKMPDKCFELAVCDPPYGGACSQSVQVEREREREREREDCAAEPQTGRERNGHASEGGLTATISAARTGGTWSTKYQTHTGGIFSKDIRRWDVAPPQEYFDELDLEHKNKINFQNSP